MSEKNGGKGPQQSEFEEVLYRSERFYEKHLKTIIIVVSVIVLIVLGIFAYKFFVVNPKEQKASQALMMAEDSFINSQDSITVYGNGKAIKGTKAVESEYKGTDAANLAYAYSGISLYDLGKYQEAIEQLSKFESSEKYVGPSILRLKGDCYVQLGKNEEAIKAYDAAIKASENPAVTPSCLIKKGRVLEFMGKYDEAIKAYSEVKDKYYTSPESKTVESDIMRCQSKKK